MLEFVLDQNEEISIGIQANNPALLMSLSFSILAQAVPVNAVQFYLVDFGSHPNNH